MIRIFHVIIGLNVGGAELMLKRLVESHHGNTNYRHTVISLTDIGKVGAQLQTLGVVVHALDMRSSKDIFRVMLRLVRLIRTCHPDVVQTWMYHADLLGGIAARLAGNRNIVWGIRTTEVKAGGSRITALVRKLCAVLSRSVPHTIVCAAEASRQLHVLAGYDAARMVVVPNGFDLATLLASGEQRRMLRTQCGFSEEHIVVGSVGRFNPVKDPRNFIQAAALIAKRYAHVRFLMVGRDVDVSNAELEYWIAQSGYPERFVLLGERTDVPRCLVAMDIFCMSSRTEGFPNVVGEAMAMGVPCVVTNVGDAAILVADTGVVVVKENSILLAEGLEQLIIMAPEIRQQLGQKAKARIQAEYTMNRARERFEDVYELVLADGIISK